MVVSPNEHQLTFKYQDSRYLCAEDSAEKNYFSHNNFDLIRLMAATQVLVAHAVDHLEIGLPMIGHLYGYFQGVPVFFFVSGFLISASWERHHNLRNFAINRFLRIYPALWAVFGFSLITFLLFGSPSLLVHATRQVVIWAATQLTVFQIYNPSFLRGYGIGVMNGSLWTLPVELSFYLFVPILYFIGHKIRNVDSLLYITAIASFSLLYSLHLNDGGRTWSFATKLLAVTPLPWLGMFTVGILFQRNMGRLYPIVAGRFWLFLALYAAIAFTESAVGLRPLFESHSNEIGIIAYLALALMVLSFAYSYRGLADQLLRQNDISYGMYIFHMPIINALIAQHAHGWGGFWLALSLTVCVASTSWLLIERPALRLRSHVLFRRSQPAAEAHG